MPAYHFVAVNSLGKEQKGVLEAENERHARQLLRDKTLLPLSLQLAQEKKTVHKTGSLFSWLKKSSLSSKDLALFTRQFATLLAAGLPIEESLFAVAEQSENREVKGLVLSVRSKVLEGHSLAAALREHKNAFSSLFCATIAAGEKSGYLDKVLMRLADYTEQQWHLQQKLKTALIYPCMIVLVAFGIVGFLLEYVVPKMIAVYGHLNQALPTMTVILIGVSHFIQNYAFYLIILLVVALFFWRRAYKQNKALQLKTHLFLLRMPLIGYVIKTRETARFSRTFAILSTAGVPVLEAMNIAAEMIRALPIFNAVQQSVLRVREGIAIHFALKQTNYFSPMSIYMMASGEASGQLSEMLERVAATQESEMTRLIEVALALFEPAIILIMGGIVLFIVLAVLLPIFQLNQFTG